MDLNLYLLFGFVIFVFAVALVGVVLTARRYASRDGERLRKKQMQGPFVPLSAEDIAEDEQRIRERHRSADGQR